MYKKRVEIGSKFDETFNFFIQELEAAHIKCTNENK